MNTGKRRDAINSMNAINYRDRTNVGTSTAVGEAATAKTVADKQGEFQRFNSSKESIRLSINGLRNPTIGLLIYRNKIIGAKPCKFVPVCLEYA